MDYLHANTKIIKWEKTLSTREIQVLNHLVNERKEAQKVVDESAKSLEEHLHIFREQCDGLVAAAIFVPSVTSLSVEIDTLKFCIDKEVEFFPESLREAHSKVIGDYSTAAIRALAAGEEFVERAYTLEPYSPCEGEREEIRLSSTEDSNS